MQSFVTGAKVDNLTSENLRPVLSQSPSFSVEIIRSLSLISQHHLPTIKPSSLLLRFIQRLTSIQVMSGVLKRVAVDT